MRLTRLFVERSTLAFVLVAVTLIGGILAARSLIVQEMPNTGLPGVSITVNYSGASTSELRDAIVKPIEDQLAGTPSLEHLDSTIQSGAAQISASFALNSSPSENLTNVQKALQAAQGQLPSDLIAPTIRTANPSEPVVVSIALTSRRYNQSKLAQIAQNSVVPAIEQISGVSSVNIKGQTQGAYEVEVDPALLAAANLTITDVIDTIASNNVRAPGGIVYGRGRETQLDVRGDIIDPASVAALPLRPSGGAVSGANSAAAGSNAVPSGAGAPSGATGPGSAAQNDAQPMQASATSVSLAMPAGPRAQAQSSASSVSTPQIGPSASPSGSAPPTAGGVSGQSGSATPVNGATTATGARSGSASTPIGTPSGAASTHTGATSGSASATNGATASSASATNGAPAGSAAVSTGAISGSTSITNGPASGSTPATNGATSGSTSGISGATSGSTSAVTGATAGSGSATSGYQTGNAAGQVTNDQAIVLQSSASSNAAQNQSTQSQAAAATVSVPSALGGQSGVSTSPYVGALAAWAMPSVDKRVGDVARVTAGSTPLRVHATVNGHVGIGLDVQKAATASEVTVSDAVVASLPSLRAKFPDIDFSLEHVQATYTRQQVDGVERTLIEGIALTAVVMLFFLRSWRNAIVVMIAIPTSLGVTLVVMNALGLTLDTISLLAMTLIIGVLVDDSTVVLENIERHHDAGEAPPEAAVNGRSEIGTAAVVITLVDVVVFAPIAFLSGPVGKQLAEFGIVVSVATLTSLIVSFTVTPTLAGLWALKSRWRPWPPIEAFTRGFERVRTAYAQRLLPAVMRRPLPVIAVAIISFVAALALVPAGIVGEDYIPAGDQGEIFVQAVFPAGTPLAHTRAQMDRVERAVLAIGNDLEAEETTSGGYDAAFGGFVQAGNVAQSHLWLREKHATSTDVWVQRLSDEARRLMPGAAVVVKPASAQSGGPKQPIDELISLDDGDDPTPYAKRIADALRATPGTQNVQNSATNVAPQMEVTFDRDMARELDVSIGTAATAVRAAFGGAQATQIVTAQGLIVIDVIYPRRDQTRLGDVLRIPIRAQNGALVHVGDIAQLRYAPAALLVTREDRADVVHVSANVAPGYQLSNVTKAIAKNVAALRLPPNVSLHAAAQGQQDLMGQTLTTLGSSLALSFVFVFLLMVALYNSYRTPLAIMFSIPFAVVGALGALALTHQTLNLYSLIGTVLLVGLVTKNGILLVDFADTLRARGRSKRDAIIESAATRFRPILMTTIAMVAGMLPLALALEPGASLRKSLGIVVIGGLSSSLVLTLLIVPLAYLWIAPRTVRAKPKTSATRGSSSAGALDPT